LPVIDQKTFLFCLSAVIIPPQQRPEVESVIDTLRHNRYPLNIYIMSHADAEEAQYQKEVEEVKQWWTDSRWRYTKRPFTAEQIIAKRGNIKIQYPGNTLSKKLWHTIEGRFKVSHTFCTEAMKVLTSQRTKIPALHMGVWTL